MKKIIITLIILLIALPSFAGGARDFVSTNSDRLSQADGLSTDLSGVNQQITVAAWVKFDSTANFMHIAGKYDFGNGNRQYQLALNGTAKYNFAVDDNGAGAFSCATSIAPRTGQWDWVVGVYDDVNVHSYVNGVRNTPATCAFTAGIFNGSAAFSIGASLSSGTYGSFLDGKIAHVQVFNRALDEGERERIGKCPGSITNGLVAHFPLTGSSSTTERNVANGGSALTVTGPDEIQDGPPIGGCLNLP